jgi:hypothetical protein
MVMDDFLQAYNDLAEEAAWSSPVLTFLKGVFIGSQVVASS